MTKTTYHSFPPLEGQRRNVRITVHEHDGYCVGFRATKRGAKVVWGEATRFGPETAAAYAYTAVLEAHEAAR